MKTTGYIIDYKEPENNMKEQELRESFYEKFTESLDELGEVRVLTNDSPEQIARFWLLKREVELDEKKDIFENLYLMNIIDKKALAVILFIIDEKLK